jgi:hypothetical protein
LLINIQGWQEMSPTWSLSDWGPHTQTTRKLRVKWKPTFLDESHQSRIRNVLLVDVNTASYNFFLRGVSLHYQVWHHGSRPGHVCTVPQQGKALLGFSDFGWETPENENLSHIIFHYILVFASQLMKIMETAVRLGLEQRLFYQHDHLDWLAELWLHLTVKTRG